MTVVIPVFLSMTHLKFDAVSVIVSDLKSIVGDEMVNTPPLATMDMVADPSLASRSI